jgi:DNA-binding SARP family transcriptional activator
VALMFQQRVDDALREFERAIELDPEFSPAYLALYSVHYESGRRERGLQILEQWVKRHPEDTQASALLEMRQRELGIAPAPMPVPPPSMPNLP